MIFSRRLGTDHSAGVVGDDQVGLDVVVLEVGIAQSTVAGLHLVVVAQAAQRLLRDVHAAAQRTKRISTIVPCQQLREGGGEGRGTHPATPPLSM